uniref:Uncharacterized protein n=1 Tax=Panagrellus redivivus TaxID=6233 RepID=A0A7E4VZ02_PANRE
MRPESQATTRCWSPIRQNRPDGPHHCMFSDSSTHRRARSEQSQRRFARHFAPDRAQIEIYVISMLFVVFEDSNKSCL